MPRKYLKKTLEIRAGATKIYVYNESGDLIRTHDRSYTPKSWVVIPSDMPREYADYGYWNKPYFLAKAESVGPETKALIQRVIEKFEYPVQSFRSCFCILRFAEKYGKAALEECCHDAILLFMESATTPIFPTPSPCTPSLPQSRWEQVKQHIEACKQGCCSYGHLQGR